LQSLQSVGHDGVVAGDTGLLLVLGGDGTCTPVLPTPVVCRSTSSLLALLALIVVEAS
jgi:hypothetical protein